MKKIEIKDYVLILCSLFDKNMDANNMPNNSASNAMIYHQHASSSSLTSNNMANNQKQQAQMNNIDVNCMPFNSSNTNSILHHPNQNASSNSVNSISTTGAGNTTNVNENNRTLYIGNLDPSVEEELIHSLFSPYGRIVNIKMINDNLKDLYCFVEYDNHQSALAALTMNNLQCLDRELKVNWAANYGNSGSSTKADTSKHYHIFVGDLSPEIETQQLRTSFNVFGEITDCRVLRDPHTQKSKGYGFVTFLKKTDAEQAIASMNGQLLGHRPIRTNWATRRTASVRNDSVLPGPSQPNRLMNYDEVYNQSSITNCTVYCGGIINGLTEELIRKNFSRFGNILEIRVFKDKGYAFIKYLSKEEATNAILMMHNKEILGQVVKCSWGKETIDTTNSVATNASALTGLTPSTSLIYPFNQQISYWYPQPSFGAAGLHQANPAATHQYHATVQAGMQYPPAAFNHQYFPSASGATSQTNATQAYNSTAMSTAAMAHQHALASAAWPSAAGQISTTNNHHHTLQAAPTSHHMSSLGSIHQTHQTSNAMPQSSSTASGPILPGAFPLLPGYPAQ